MANKVRVGIVILRAARRVTRVTLNFTLESPPKFNQTFNLIFALCSRPAGQSDRIGWVCAPEQLLITFGPMYSEWLTTRTIMAMPVAHIVVVVSR
jgi:hypothetical protein